MKDDELLELLQKFCAGKNDPFMPWARTPFTLHGHTYATNNHVLVRCRFLSSVPDACDGTPNDSLFDRKWWTHQKAYHQWGPLPTYDPNDLRQCSECKGKGQVADCEECGGSGDVEWETDRHSYSASCKSCQGDGTVPIYESDKEPSECTRCLGSGKEPVCVPFGDYSGHRGISSLYIDLLSALPGIKISTYQTNPQSHFSLVFDDGVGIVMPMIRMVEK